MKRRVQLGLRTTSHTRTDQFAVAKQLEGLQEKFRILNRDELAEALQSQLVELEKTRNSWFPEILCLLLQLSDRPALLSTVKHSAEGVETAETKQSLSWSHINVEGIAFNDEDIWEKVDFAGDSSDDDFSVASDASFSRQRPQSSTTVEEDYVVPDDMFLSAQDEDVVTSIRKAQFWKPENQPVEFHGKDDSSRLITESQLCREVIFMLQGLPTSVFRHLDGEIKVNYGYKLAHSSNEALASLLQCFSEIGANINVIRRFTKVPQTIPYMQTFCRAIEERLLEFDKILSQLQCKHLSVDYTISILQLLADVRQHSHELLLLSDMIAKLGEISIDQPMRCIDLLYDLICMHEALGDETSSRNLAQLFFMCFKTYTRSARLWMEKGQVDALDSTFFVRTIHENGGLRTLWHDWYVLDMGHKGQKVPKFLATSIQKVFTAGKSMVFLRHLNAMPDPADSQDDNCPLESSLSLPFSALVESAFEKLVNVDHSLSASLLRTELGQQCGLWASLDALHHVYLGKDMSATSAIDAKIFELLDRGRFWDRFLLTEVARTAFAPISVVETSKLLIRPANLSSSQYQTRSVRVFQAISIDYGLPWPIANIITEDVMHSYQRVSTFLMQIRRAKYSIVKQRIRDARRASETDTLVNILRHNMLWFLDFLYGHLTYLVISTETQALHKALSGAQDVDAMIAAYQSYMVSLEAQCLLSKDLSQVHEAIISILDLCVHFASLQTAHSLDGQDSGLSAVNMKTSRATKLPGDDFDSDDDHDYEDDELSHEQTLTASFSDSSYIQQVQKVKHQFDHLATFVIHSLKGRARADGLPSWEILADRLEWRQN